MNGQVSSDNDGVWPSGPSGCTGANGISKTPRKSTISVGLKRTLSTAQFETLVIEMSTEEAIEWQNIEEWQTKFRNWQTIFVNEFKQAHDRILDELQLTHKKAYFKNSTAETVARYAKKGDVADQIESNSPLEDLDKLDILGNDQ
jgi:hypothetical protein